MDSLIGQSFLIRFSRPLDQSAFDRLVAGFRRRNNRFRLWANPIRLGPGKAHLYAVDCELWQTIDFELTRDHVIGVLPTGARQDSIDRLIARIRRFVDAKARGYINAEPVEGPK